MMDLLARDFSKASDDIDNQAIGFMGSCLPKTPNYGLKQAG